METFVYEQITGPSICPNKKKTTTERVQTHMISL